MESIRKFLRKIITPIKVVGLIALIAHCVVSGIHFEPIWVLAYVVILFLAALVVHGLERFVEKIFEMLRSSDRGKREEQESLYFCHRAYTSIRQKPWVILLIPGEDGFFFLPLIYIGVTPITVGIASALFVFVHLLSNRPKTCIMKFFSVFATHLLVLPHGILTVVAGHVICDLLAVLLLRKHNKTYVAEAQQCSGQVLSGAKHETNNA